MMQAADTPVETPMVSEAEPVERALRFATRLELLEACVQIVTGARRRLAIYSRDLDPAVLDQAQILTALRSLSLGGRGAQIRILLHDPGRAVREGHRLIEQARRLGSVYELRQVQAEDLEYSGAFIVNDRAGFLARSFADRPEGEGHTHDSARCNALLRYFDEVWQRAMPAAELRALSL